MTPQVAASTPAASEPDRVERAQRVIDDFVAAGRRGDAGGAASLVSTSDQAFASRAAVWAANLHRITWSQLTWTVRSAGADLSARRRAALGDDAWVQQVDVSWKLAGEGRTGEERLWLTFVEEPAVDGTGSATVLASDSDSPKPNTPAPIWLQQPVELHRDGSVLVLTHVGDADAWVLQAAAARRVVAARVGRAGHDPDGVLVVEVPQSRVVFERILGVRPGSYATVAAAAWPMGRDAGTAPVHVVVNPEASGRLSELGRNVLLTHEAVHVMTRSPASPAPTWLVEGYADEIAYDAYKGGKDPAEQTVHDHLHRYGVQRDWPDDDDFAPDSPDLDLSYDLAWTAVDSIATAYGNSALNRFYAAVDAGHSIDEAADEIGTTQEALLRRWRADLERLATR